MYRGVALCCGWLTCCVLLFPALGVARPAGGLPERAPPVAPFPAPANTSLGRFHLLPGLQCDTAAPGVVGGVRGFFLRPPLGGEPMAVPVGEGACWSPVVDTTTQTTQTSTHGRVQAVSIGPTGPVLSVVPESIWDVWNLVLGLGTAAPEGRYVHDEAIKLLPPARMPAGGTERLLEEASVLRLLTLQRNSMGGSVHRVVGTYDVAAVSRVTVGFCRTRLCWDMSAVNVLGARGQDYYNDTHLGLLAYNPPDGVGVYSETRRHVSIGDADLLSLGRAALVRPSRLSAAATAGVPSWRLRAAFFLDALSIIFTVGSPSRRTYPLGSPWDRGDRFVDMGNTSTATDAAVSTWLQAVNYILCAPPHSSFVDDSSIDRLCGSWAEAPSLDSAAAGNAHKQHKHWVSWRFDPDAHLDGSLPLHEAPHPPPAEEQPLPLCNFSATRDEATHAQPRPGWLVGRAEREINPAAAAEVALARALSVCAHEVNALEDPSNSSSPRLEDDAPPFLRLPWIRYFSSPEPSRVENDVARLSQQYDRTRWGVDAPVEPASNAAIVLSIIVILPEAVALVALVLTNPRWGRRDWMAFLFIWAAGGVSTAGVIQAAVNEAGGQRWRGSSERIVLSARLHQVEEKGHDRRLDRVPLFQTETLFLAARLGYRVRLLSGLAIGVTCTYMALSVGVAALAVRQTRREHMSWARDMDTAAANDDARHAGRVSTGTVRRYIHLPPNLAYRRSAAAAAEQEAADEWWA
ncbi:hypothetical protein I4F81_008450 [Pyropia yezoensis]|uniref:Uncharacterized protein n=1 Tax=Pyropia yezoensis TaxID=2788 RepID=A0ACC3C782_PYRYE|nr:hypothetical protein I4F81_008450 [Neopyropia yezoensis]